MTDRKPKPGCKIVAVGDVLCITVDGHKVAEWSGGRWVSKLPGYEVRPNNRRLPKLQVHYNGELLCSAVEYGRDWDS
jgi:hypothetical protein